MSSVFSLNGRPLIPRRAVSAALNNELVGIRVAAGPAAINTVSQAVSNAGIDHQVNGKVIKVERINLKRVLPIVKELPYPHKQVRASNRRRAVSASPTQQAVRSWLRSNADSVARAKLVHPLIRAADQGHRQVRAVLESYADRLSMPIDSALDDLIIHLEEEAGIRLSNRRHISMSHTSSHTITFSSKSRARKFASKCAAFDGCSVKCSGLKVRVRHPIKMSRRVLSAAHRLQK